MTDIAIQVDQLGKRYRLGETKPSRILREGLLSIARPGARARKEAAEDTGAGGFSASGKSFWALRDVSFRVNRGEVLGVIGRNGAGKSTLLKILSRIIEPTEGRCEIHGRVGSLLEVGTGFHPELSGRENMYLNGAILGMKRSEIRARFDEIVAFAEIEKFIDTPVKRYSSGMYTRLAFAVAAHLTPEVLIVDEVLAVGDASFQKKCLGKMNDVAQQGRTVLFVSHSMAAVSQLTSRCVYLKQGSVEFVGPTAEAVDRYASASGAVTDPDVSSIPRHAPHHGTKLRVMRIAPVYGDGTLFPLDSPLEFDVDVQASVERKDVHFAATITDASGTGIMTGADARAVTVPAGLTRFRVSFRQTRLVPGVYTLALALLDNDMHGPRNHYDVVRPGAHFEIGTQAPDNRILFNWGPTLGHVHHDLISVQAVPLDQPQSATR